MDISVKFHALPDRRVVLLHPDWHQFSFSRREGCMHWCRLAKCSPACAAQRMWAWSLMTSALPVPLLHRHATFHSSKIWGHLLAAILMHAGCQASCMNCFLGNDACKDDTSSLLLLWNVLYDVDAVMVMVSWCRSRIPGRTSCPGSTGQSW